MEGHIVRGLMATLGIDLAKVYPTFIQLLLCPQVNVFWAPSLTPDSLRKGGFGSCFPPCKLPVVNAADSHHLSTLFTYLVSLNKCLKLQICPVIAIICQ